METRREQLRTAKRRQRLRDRQDGHALYQLKLPAVLRDRLKVGMRSRAFVTRLHAFLRHELICVDDFPGLSLLCWNREVRYMTREDAFGLYERNWRLIEPEELTRQERALIEMLKREFGRSVINA